jgi:hypothetical protein
MADTFYNTERELKLHFGTFWKARVPNVPLAWVNGKPYKPSSVDPDNPGDDEWVEGEVIFISRTHDVLGAREGDVVGSFIVKIFTPRNRGTGRATSYVDLVTNIWDTARDNGLDGNIKLGAIFAVPGGMESTFPYRVVIVDTPFSVRHFPTT